MNPRNNPPVRQNISREMFFENAKRISANPLTRISNRTRTRVSSILANEGLYDAFVDVHMHAFTNKNIPRDFAITSTGISRDLLELASKIFVKRTHHLVNSTPAEIIDDLLSHYKQTLHLQENDSKPELFLVLLMMDMERGITGGVEEDFIGQMKKVLELKNDYQFSYESDVDNFTGKDHLLPFLAIDPNNPDAFSLFLSAFAKTINDTDMDELEQTTPFVGIKIYPSLGYLPNHPTLMDIFEVCEEKSIPVTAHAGGERTHTSYKVMNLPRSEYDATNDRYIDKWDAPLVALEKNRNKYYKPILLYPDRWRPVLDANPELKLNIAHFGSSDEWANNNDPDTWNSLDQTFRLIQDFSSVYADFSYAFAKKKNMQYLKRRIDGDRYLATRVMYGSDFYLNEIMRGTVRDHLNNVLNIMPRPDYPNIYFSNAIRFMFEKVVIQFN
ncbi:MAG: amidohydrolase family protein [Saprospiraceae bacterium]|nr:amidohydrolase family protein [Saprospiraceae bacterium]